MLLVLKWMKDKGGVKGLMSLNAKKAKKIYAAVDRHDIYVSKVAPRDRSEMNACFYIKGGIETQFVEEALKYRIIGVKGHREAGGLRVSLYNPVSLEAVEHLVGFMEQFASTRR